MNTSSVVCWKAGIAGKAQEHWPIPVFYQYLVVLSATLQGFQVKLIDC